MSRRRQPRSLREKLSEPEFTEAYMKALGDGMNYSGRTTLSAMLTPELPTTVKTLKG
jgi:hypothetical protein